MSDKQNGFECTVVCWAIAAFVGVVAMVMLYMLAEFAFLQAFFVGGFIGLLLGLGLSLFVCRGQTAAEDLASENKPAQRYASQAAADKASGEAGTSAADASAADAATTTSATTTSAPAASAAAAASTAAEPAQFAGVKPSQPLPGQEELAARKGTWKYEKEPEEAPAPKAKKAAPKKAPAKKTATKKAPAKKAAAKADAGGADVAEVTPELYASAPAEGADNLKLISGVGPKLEQTLNDLGIYRFAQVATWGAAEIAWVDARLRFKGRIERDDWMSQAKILAEGGETEFSKRSKK